MTVQAKICGINSEVSMRAAVDGGAAFVGLVFFPPSPRAVSVAQSIALAGLAPPQITKVGLFVEPTDEELEAAVGTGILDMIQLHGMEPPVRAREIRDTWGLPVMKAFGLASNADLGRPAAYDGIADFLLFDGLGDPDSPIPGGNAAAFDWRILSGTHWPAPWMLAGGLTAENVARAVNETGAQIVDVSSGVESRRGEKDPELIAAFLRAVASL
jgi:phosphoribosylanthranilate isomerase